METSRRNFVIKSALAATGMAYGYQSVAAVNQAELKPFNASVSNGPAKICFFSKDLPGFGYNEMASLVAETGFDGIDLTVRKKGHVKPENVERDLPLAVAAAKKYGLKIYMITRDIVAAEERFTETILKTASSLGEGMVDFRKFIALLTENKMQGPFYIHCEYLSNKDNLIQKGEK